MRRFPLLTVVMFTGCAVGLGGCGGSSSGRQGPVQPGSASSPSTTPTPVAETVTTPTSSRAPAAVLPSSAPGSPAAATGAAEPARAVMTPYFNARYGYRAARPLSFAASGPVSDGQTFSTDHGQVAEVLAAVDNTAHLTPAQQLKQDEIAVHVTYHVVVGDVVTISGLTTDGDTIVYIRDVVGAGSINTLGWSYPVSQRAQWATLVDQTVADFQPGDVAHPH